MRKDTHFTLTTSLSSIVALTEKLLVYQGESTYIDAIDFMGDVVVISGVVENDAMWQHFITLAESV